MCHGITEGGSYSFDVSACYAVAVAFVRAAGSFAAAKICKINSLYDDIFALLACKIMRRSADLSVFRLAVPVLLGFRSARNGKWDGLRISLCVNGQWWSVDLVCLPEADEAARGSLSSGKRTCTASRVTRSPE